MKKIITLLALVLFAINTNAQEAKTSTSEKAKKEKCCSKKETKKMSAEEIEKCQAKCKAEGKKCEQNNCSSLVRLVCPIPRAG